MEVYHHFVLFEPHGPRPELAKFHAYRQGVCAWQFRAGDLPCSISSQGRPFCTGLELKDLVKEPISLYSSTLPSPYCQAYRGQSFPLSCIQSAGSQDAVASTASPSDRHRTFCKTMLRLSSAVLERRALIVSEHKFFLETPVPRQDPIHCPRFRSLEVHICYAMFYRDLLFFNQFLLLRLMSLKSLRIKPFDSLTI